MTAPAAPVITAHTNGAAIRVTFRPVATATYYHLYAGPATAPSTLVASILAAAIGADGWFESSFIPLDADSYVAVSAFNVLDEESAKSNERRVTLTGSGNRHTTSDPYGAYDRRD